MWFQTKLEKKRDNRHKTGISVTQIWSRVMDFGMGSGYRFLLQITSNHIMLSH